jgi:hypothetical protein
MKTATSIWPSVLATPDSRVASTLPAVAAVWAFACSLCQRVD